MEIFLKDRVATKIFYLFDLEHLFHLEKVSIDCAEFYKNLFAYPDVRKKFLFICCRIQRE